MSLLKDLLEGNTIFTDWCALGSKKIIEKVNFFSEI